MCSKGYLRTVWTYRELLAQIISYSPLKHSKCKTVRTHRWDDPTRAHTATLTRNVSIFKQLSSKNWVLCAHTRQKNTHTDQQGLVFKSALIVCNCLDFFSLHNSYRCCFKSCFKTVADIAKVKKKIFFKSFFSLCLGIVCIIVWHLEVSEAHIAGPVLWYHEAVRRLQNQLFSLGDLLLGGEWSQIFCRKS